MTAEPTQFDPAWDAIDATATGVAELEGGRLYEQNATSDGAACIIEPAVKVEDWTTYFTST